jgi:hypothetical protein
MTLKFSLTVSDNLQIFGFFLLKSVSRAKNSRYMDLESE